MTIKTKLRCMDEFPHMPRNLDNRHEYMRSIAADIDEAAKGSGVSVQWKQTNPVDQPWLGQFEVTIE